MAHIRFFLLLILLSSLFGIAEASDTVQVFLDRHWSRPVPPQGLPPKHFSAAEAALDPNSCGTCHAAQLADWQGSFHARAMGPGVLGQLLDMKPKDRNGHQDCLRCHAPLAEQADGLVAQMTRQDRSGLHKHGMMCAACHVRDHQRFGPPRRDGSVPQPGEALPHDGFTASTAFQDSRFCASCHQFEPGGFALNGKLLENTYEEWNASRYQREGKPCQSCHMPERRHLWRGIHDQEMVKNGVTITSSMNMAQGRAQARLLLRNSGVGHYFPTYVTPKVHLEIYQEDHAGKPITNTLMREVIGREVPLDISREISDTRLAPDAERALAYDRPVRRTAVSLVARARVEPDAFYEKVYRALLSKNQTREGKALIRQALADAQTSGFEIYRQRYPLKR